MTPSKHLNQNDLFQIFISTLPYKVGFKWSLLLRNTQIKMIHLKIYYDPTVVGRVQMNFTQCFEKSFWFECFEGVKFIWTLPYRVGSKWIFQTNHFDFTVSRSYRSGYFEGVISILVFRRSHFDFSVSKESFWFECFEGVISISVFRRSHSDLSASKESFLF